MNDEKQDMKGKHKVKNSLNGWRFLFILAIVCISLIIGYRAIFKGEKIEFTSSDLNSTQDSYAASRGVDLGDFIHQANNVSDIYSVQKPIRGIFLTANTAGIADKLDNLIRLANETTINAFVIDVKNDNGHITYDMNVPMVEEIGAEVRVIKNIDEVMDKLYDNNIYPIARIVAFKDPYLSSKKTDLAIKNQDGSLFMYKNASWVSPYNKDAWKYIIDIAKEAARTGFKEIQFDYIRFEATKSLETANFGDVDATKSRIDVITEFIEYAVEELEPFDVVVSADVFGTIITSEVDANMIGQNYVEMAKRLDVICPMVYPSHYGRGYFGLPSSAPPDLYPYEIIYGSMNDSATVLQEITNKEDQPIVRPWLQAFTASYLGSGNYMTYDGDAIRKQIQAAYDIGLTEWLLWNPSNRYGADGLIAE